MPKKKQTKQTFYDARLPDGTVMPVPRGISGDELARYVAAEQKRRQEESAAAEAATNKLYLFTIVSY